MMEQGDVDALASLLDAINTVSGAEGDKGEEEAAEENKNTEGTGNNTSTQPQTTPTTNENQ